MAKYDPKQIEQKWQEIWEKEQTFKVETDPSKKKFFGLIEFPYPSGEGLHVGHPRPFTAMDVITRKRRMEGFNVLYPIGFDAFGLPTENFAIKTKQKPADVTKRNIANFTRQLKMLGYGFDWSRVIDTTDPKYFKWTQWIFLQFFKHGLAYKKNQPINWCPKDKIGLANEEVVQGCCERCGTAVEQRNKEQWMLAITKYADKLLEGLKEVDYITPARVQQENWIGKSEGALVQFLFAGTQGVVECEFEDREEGVEVFTTRPDTLFGVTYVVVAPEHPLVTKVLATLPNYKQVKEYVESARKKSNLERTELQKEKTGVPLEGVTLYHPVTKEPVEVWVGDYVLANYGTGAVMAVPAHDERDFEFAAKFGLKIKQVVESVFEGQSIKSGEKFERIDGGGNEMAVLPFIRDGRNINSDFLNGLETSEAKKLMTTWLEKNKLGQAKVNFKLRDWVFSRQRYWGEPIPLVYCAHCAEKKDIKSKGEEMNPGWIPLDEKVLPLELPKVENYEPTDTGESPLAAITDWVKTTCPRCGGEARRETDTMPNWAGSSWYFLRYTDPNNDQALASKENLQYWMAVDWYNGGMEHTVLHLLYSRFWNQFLYDIGAVPTLEPYKKRTSHGMILAADGEKMSKSRGNVINPDEMVDQFGADALRTYIMFMGPFDQYVQWDTNGLVGVRRFIDRVWNVQEYLSEKVGNNQTIVHQTTKKVSEDIDKMSFNTAIAKLMELVNHFFKEQKITHEEYGVLARLVAPFAPHVAEEIWQTVLGNKGSVAYASWPNFKQELTIESKLTLAVQVNGKVRDTIEVDVGITEDTVKSLVMQNEKVTKWFEGKEPKKIIYVKGKLVSVVV